MSDYELHEPTFAGTTAERWEAPDPDTLDGANVGSIDGHYLLSESGFPPSSIDDLALPVVDERGRLNRNALANAAHGPGSVEALDVADDLEVAVKDAIHQLLRDEFEGTAARKGEVARQLLAREEHQAEHEHEVAQKLHTDDEQRRLDAEEQVHEQEGERPEKGR